MTIKEENLSDESKAVLAIVREEAMAGRLTPKQVEFLNNAVVMYEAAGIVGKFILWFAGILAAIATLWSYLPKRGV